VNRICSSRLSAKLFHRFPQNRVALYVGINIGALTVKVALLDATS
jgi:hypothetical protein